MKVATRLFALALLACVVAPAAGATILADRHHLYRSSASAEASWLILDRSLVCRYRSPANTCWQHGVSAWNPLARVQLSHSAGTGTSCAVADVTNGTCPTNNLMTTAYGQDYGATGWGIAWWWYGEWTVDGRPHRHLFKGFVVNNTTSLYLNRDQNTICHEVGHQLGLDHWYDRRASCLEDSVAHIHGWTCKDQPTCDNPHSQDSSEIDNDLMAHTDASYTDPQCLIYPCFQGGAGKEGSGWSDSRPRRVLLAEHVLVAVPLNPPPFGSITPETVLRVYEIPGLSLDPRDRVLLYTIVQWRGGSKLVPAGG